MYIASNRAPLSRPHETQIGEFFNGTQNSVEPGAAIGIQHAIEIQTERLGNQHQGAEIQRKFQPLTGVHGR